MCSDCSDLCIKIREVFRLVPTCSDLFRPPSEHKKPKKDIYSEAISSLCTLRLGGGIIDDPHTTTIDEMIGWIQDGMAFRDDVEKHIDLLAERGIISREDADGYLARISSLMDGRTAPVVLPPREDYDPVPPEINPLQWIDVLFPRRHPNEPPDTKKGQIRDTAKVPFVQYLYDAGYVRVDDGQHIGWYRDNGRYMEAVDPSEVEEEICRAATGCMVDLPSRSWAAATITQAG